MRLSSQIFAYSSWKLFKSCETEALSSPLLSFLGNIPFKEYLPVRYFELLITICQFRRPFLSLLVFNLSCINFHRKSFLLYPNHSLYLRGRPSQFLAFFFCLITQVNKFPVQSFRFYCYFSIVARPAFSIVHHISASSCRANPLLSLTQL